ncbi:semaphorin-5A-like [Pecten maximus]|uniref:semaphorin-5A-like n=1 Tax=Pecten maximus TaxID=6579 RepID=UPI001457FF17|nr:semaphorin-5A-like [Pecten maximus]
MYGLLPEPDSGTQGAGGWGGWGEWDECSVTCGTGNRQRERNCDNPSQMGGGANCRGSSVQTTACVLTACPVDGVWGSWEQWGACPVTCDSGNQFRNRTCDNPTPSNGGIYCQGRSFDSKQCTLAACPVHGGWASWKSWSSCALVNKNVKRTRCRTCTNPVPENGGNSCPRRRIHSERCAIPKSALRRPCRCPISRVAVAKNISADELVELVNNIKEELSVDVSKLSKTIRKKISVKDTRSSVKTIGVLGTIMLIIPLSIVIGLDLLNVYRYFKQDKVGVEPGDGPAGSQQ